ncbi:MAG: histidinol-phosphatase [Chloroflexota bacterium]|nr:histidinol-phosphatase [Chloroflexota bacterium]MDE2950105.1 histidinol-phosphatase [Chloroflexota bacterium]
MQEFLDFSKELAGASGDVIMRYFRSDIAVETKSDESPVTIADKQAEEIMREMIMKAYPAHGIIGEEFGNHNEDAEYQWVLDPIDGTKSFVSGTFLFGTLIGLMKDGQPIVGAIHHPLTSHLLIGAGGEARLNDEIVRVRPTRELREAVMLYTDFIHVGQYQNGIAFQQLMGKTKFNRTWGDCHGYFLLATGYADIMLDPIMHLWDIVALIPIIEGAGGKITSWNGGPPLSGNGVIASNGPLHSQVLRVLIA